MIINIDILLPTRCPGEKKKLDISRRDLFKE